VTVAAFEVSAKSTAASRRGHWTGPVQGVTDVTMARVNNGSRGGGGGGGGGGSFAAKAATVLLLVPIQRGGQVGDGFRRWI
jgi:hypothetical protein